MKIWILFLCVAVFSSKINIDQLDEDDEYRVNLQYGTDSTNAESTGSEDEVEILNLEDYEEIVRKEASNVTYPILDDLLYKDYFTNVNEKDSEEIKDAAENGHNEIVKILAEESDALKKCKVLEKCAELKLKSHLDNWQTNAKQRTFQQKSMRHGLRSTRSVNDINVDEEDSEGIQRTLSMRDFNVDESSEENDQKKPNCSRHALGLTCAMHHRSHSSEEVSNDEEITQKSANLSEAVKNFENSETDANQELCEEILNKLICDALFEKENFEDVDTIDLEDDEGIYALQEHPESGLDLIPNYFDCTKEREKNLEAFEMVENPNNLILNSIELSPYEKKNPFRRFSLASDLGKMYNSGCRQLQNRESNVYQQNVTSRVLKSPRSGNEIIADDEDWAEMQDGDTKNFICGNLKVRNYFKFWRNIARQQTLEKQNLPSGGPNRKRQWKTCTKVVVFGGALLLCQGIYCLYAVPEQALHCQSLSTPTGQANALAPWINPLGFAAATKCFLGLESLLGQFSCSVYSRLFKVPEGTQPQLEQGVETQEQYGEGVETQPQYGKEVENQQPAELSSSVVYNRFFKPGKCSKNDPAARNFNSHQDVLDMVKKVANDKKKRTSFNGIGQLKN